MRSFFVLLAIPILTAFIPLDHFLARGGGGGHGGGGHGSGAVRGSGYVNPFYHWTSAITAETEPMFLVITRQTLTARSWTTIPR
jgi:hypothetical protein